MKRRSVGVVLLVALVAATAFNGAGSSVDSSTGHESVAGVLPSFGAVTLIAGTYTASRTVPCPRGANNGNTDDPIGRCGEADFDPDTAEFDSTGSTTAVCNGLDQWSLLGTTCFVKSDGHVQFTTNITNPNGSVPCDGTAFAQVTLTNHPSGDTLTIAFDTNDNGNTNCTTY